MRGPWLAAIQVRRGGAYGTLDFCYTVLGTSKPAILHSIVISKMTSQKLFDVSLGGDIGAVGDLTERRR